MTRTAICMIAAVGSLACIKAPAIVAVDRATALEQQAGGSYPELEKKLEREAVSSRPVALTPAQLEALGVSSSSLSDEHDQTEAERVDDLLERHCVGEGNDGLLADTSKACHDSADHDELVKLVDRTNRARMQLWRWMQEQQPSVTIDEVRKRWRVTHVRGVTCGAWMQDDAGQWTAKRC